MSTPLDQATIDRLSIDYQKQQRAGFFATFKRNPINDKELIAFSLAAYIVDRPELANLCDAAAGVAKLHLSKEEAAKFTKYAAFCLIRDAVTMLQVLADLQLVEEEAKGNKINKLPNVYTPLDPKEMD